MGWIEESLEIEIDTGQQFHLNISINVDPFEHFIDGWDIDSMFELTETDDIEVSYDDLSEEVQSKIDAKIEKWIDKNAYDFEEIAMGMEVDHAYDSWKDSQYD